MVRLITFLAIACMQLASAQEHPREWWERLYAFRALHQDIAFNYLEGGKILPSSLEEFEGMRLVAGIGKKRLSPHGIKAINSFVIVPNAPEIKKGPGVPDTLVGKRLYIISRFPNHDRAPAGADPSDPLSGGRQAIMISDADSKTDIPWIPEPTAQLLIKQIEGFHPMEQTSAFVSEAKAAGLSVTELTTPLSDQESTTDIPADRATAERNRLWVIYILIAAAIISAAIIFVYRSSSRRK